jgi:hypothetical protein
VNRLDDGESSFAGNKNYNRKKNRRRLIMVKELVPISDGKQGDKVFFVVVVLGGEEDTVRYANLLIVFK